MPRADFRVKGDALDPLAPVKVLSVMCHPGDARGREHMMRRASEPLVFPRNRGVRHYPDDLRRRALWADFLDHGPLGCVAGAVALALAQVKAMNMRVEQAAVAALATNIVGQIEIEDQPGQTGSAVQAGQTLQASTIAAAFEAYRSVSHLWAALVYGSLKNRLDLQPVSAQTLPVFIAYAEEIARLAGEARSQESQQGLSLEPTLLWTFLVPAAHRKTVWAHISSELSAQATQWEAGHVSQPPQTASHSHLEFNVDA